MDRGLDEVLLRIDPVLADDLLTGLRWRPIRSDPGDGWRIPRAYMGDLHRAASHLGITLFDVWELAS